MTSPVSEYRIGNSIKHFTGVLQWKPPKLVLIAINVNKKLIPISSSLLSIAIMIMDITEKKLKTVTSIQYLKKSVSASSLDSSKYKAFNHLTVIIND